MEKKKLPMPKLPTVATLNLKQKVGQLFMPAAFIHDTEAEIKKLEQNIKNHSIGSLCFFHSRASVATNFEDTQVAIHNQNSYKRLQYLIQRYQKASPIPLLIAIDAEWGLAMRIENTPQYPFAITLGAMEKNENLVFQVGKAIANDCGKTGIHWNLAPVVDINTNPKNPVINYRSFGSDKNKVTNYAKAYLKGMQSKGILNCIKHFPGHGDTAIDSHLGLPVIQKSKKQLLNLELYPFAALMDDDLDAIMMGHLAVPVLAHGKNKSASISREITTEFLRKELNWKGLIISDALNMQAISKNYTEPGELEQAAFEAGNDILCFTNNIKTGIQRIVTNCNADRIEASFQRFWKLKKKIYNKAAEQPQDTPYQKMMMQLASESLTLHKGNQQELSTFNMQGFQFVQIGKSDGFFKKQLRHHQTKNGKVLLSIMPRQIKPKENFGFMTSEIQQMHQLLNQKEVIIYLFGNPYVLNLIPWKKAKAVVVAYQDLEAFQKSAMHHFNGSLIAKGSLPIQLKQNHE